MQEGPFPKIPRLMLIIKDQNGELNDKSLQEIVIKNVLKISLIIRALADLQNQEFKCKYILSEKRLLFLNRNIFDLKSDFNKLEFFLKLTAELLGKFHSNHFHLLSAS
jgi:hypothetical protein